MKTLRTAALVSAGVGCAALFAARQFLRRPKFEWEDKSVLITGGSRGLGLVLARQLVAKGARVAICARSEEDLRAAADELRGSGATVLDYVCDIRDQRQVRTLIETVQSRWGGIDVLFNVAGVMTVGPLESMTLNDFHAAMDTNYWGGLHMALAVLPSMRKRRRGRIVNVVSIGGLEAVPHMLPYDASKFAMSGLSRGLRAEVAKDGVQVTTVYPTLMRTGSPRNAEFKGQHRAEYLWFSLGGSLPLVSMSAERAAAQIIRGCEAGQAEVYVSNVLNPPMLACRFVPQLTARVFAMVNALLPAQGGIGTRSAWGYESQSSLSPSWLTTLGDLAARRNNEMRPRQKRLAAPQGASK